MIPLYVPLYEALHTFVFLIVFFYSRALAQCIATYLGDIWTYAINMYTNLSISDSWHHLLIPFTTEARFYVLNAMAFST